MRQHSGNKHSYIAVGVMSGTSLDGIDLAAAHFSFENHHWKYELLHAATFNFEPEWKNRLAHAHLSSGFELAGLNNDFGTLTAQLVNKFVGETAIKPDLIATHGHTVFHDPEKGLTLQIGNGAIIAAQTNTVVVADFRTGDVALGGQGAPLVPAGDLHLFGEFDYCLNLGGFSNLSWTENNTRVAGDICAVNTVLNFLAMQLNQAFDKNGDLGRKGNINVELLNALNELEFYRKPFPKSLGREWVEEKVLPLFLQFQDTVPNSLATYYQHIAPLIAGNFEKDKSVLVTGGGAFNSFLMEKLQLCTQARLVLPNLQLIKFREALIFAFLGVLKLRNEINCLASVTGAGKDSSAGVIFRP